MHLAYNMVSLSLNKHTSIHKAKESQTYIRNPSIHLTCENLIIHLNKIATPNMAASISSKASKSIYEQGINFIHIHQRRIKQATCMFM